MSKETVNWEQFLGLLQHESQTADDCVQIFARLSEEENKQLIDESMAKKAEDWSALCHQVVGFESK